MFANIRRYNSRYNGCKLLLLLPVNAATRNLETKQEETVKNWSRYRATKTTAFERARFNEKHDNDRLNPGGFSANTLNAMMVTGARPFTPRWPHDRHAINILKCTPNEITHLQSDYHRLITLKIPYHRLIILKIP